MNSNTHSARPAEPLTALAAVVEGLAAQDPDGLSDTVRAERVLVLVRLLDRLEGHWLNELAGVDARGAAGAEAGVQAGSTAGWLRARLRMGAAAASNAVRTARALFAGPLPRTAQALTAGSCRWRMSACSRSAPTTCPPRSPPRPNRSWWRRPAAWTRPGCDESWAICGWSPTRHRRPPDPSGAMRGGACGSRPPWRRWWRWMGCWSPRPARSCWSPWSPWPAPQRRRPPQWWPAAADALAELARRTLEGGRLPQTGGVRPQLLVTVDLDSLQGRPGLGGD